MSVMTLSVVALTLYALGKALRKLFFLPIFTVLDDLKPAGVPRADHDRIPGRAIVCGGSIAGLLTAAVCADHFQSVTVVAPESWANDNQQAIELPQERLRRTQQVNGRKAPMVRRSRIMQYLYLHFYQPLVFLGLQRLFPNHLQEALDHFGYTPRQVLVHIRQSGVLSPEPYLEGDPRAPKTLFITREGFETLVRWLVVKSRPHVKFVTGTVTGYINIRKDTLNGVTISPSNSEGREKEEKLEGVFVVDATGPSQQSYHRWLPAAGYSLPKSIRNSYDPHSSYSQSSRKIPSKYHAKLDEIIPGGFKPGMIYNHGAEAETGENRNFVMLGLEGAEVLVFQAAWDVDLPAHTITDIKPFLSSLHGAEHIPPFVYELLEFLEEHDQEGDFETWSSAIKLPSLSYIRYDELAGKGRLPRNWVAVGDAAMKLNPVYGQGCSKAMSNAITLDAVLRTLRSNELERVDLSTKYFKRVTPREVGSWQGSKANDYGWSSTTPAEGETLHHGRFLRSFAGSVLHVGQKSATVQWAFWHVNMSLAPPIDFLSPVVFSRILWNILTQ